MPADPAVQCWACLALGASASTPASSVAFLIPAAVPDEETRAPPYCLSKLPDQCLSCPEAAHLLKMVNQYANGSVFPLPAHRCRATDG